MIEDSRPRYKIKYMECQRDKSHEGQFLNFVCLQDECRDDSLICSMCRNEKHKGHPTHPLKFYLEQLKKDYEENTRDFNQQFEFLEEAKTKFFYKLKECVEKVAEQFQKLEEEVMEKFHLIHKELLQQQLRKTKFNDFYRSLSGQNSDQSASFLIRDYLPKKQLKIPANLAGFDKLAAIVSKEVALACSQILIGEEQQQQIDYKQHVKVPKSISVKENIYTQTNHASTTECLGILDLNLLKQFQNAKVRIKIKRLKKATITLGAITKDLYNTLSAKVPTVWNSPTYTGKLFYFNNFGVVFGQSKSQLKAYGEGANLQISMTGENKMKIGMKKSSAQYTLPLGSSYYFFFGLQGNAEIELNFLKTK